MLFKNKIKRVYIIIKKFYDIMSKYSPMGSDDLRLIFFGLFINALSNYTAGNTLTNTLTLIVVCLALVFLKKKKE